jgi:menaquinone-9 beta-reductase
MPHSHYDVVIVGGAVAGCVAALSYARRGLQVAVLERRPSSTDYKMLCTHFIQPVGLPVLKELGLDRTLEASGAVRTKAAFWTRAGWVDPPGGYTAEPATGHAYNIERRVLDPLLRGELLRTERIDLLLGRRVTAIEKDGDGWKVEAKTAGDEHFSSSARLVVAADGRDSPIAAMLHNQAQSDENQRAAYFGYFVGITPPDLNRSLFLLGDEEMGFLYPLAEGRTLLAAYITRDRAAEWRRRGDLATRILEFMAGFPDLPSLSGAQPASRILGYLSYPNLTRKAVWNGVPFIGDAALSLDPMSGVGCSFAIVSAAMLVEQTWQPLSDGGDLSPGLARFEAAFDSFFLPHAQGIKADSIIAKTPESVQQTYKRIVASPKLQTDFIALTGRLISPRQFQQSYLIAATRGNSDKEPAKSALLAHTAGEPL